MPTDIITVKTPFSCIKSNLNINKGTTAIITTRKYKFSQTQYQLTVGQAGERFSSPGIHIIF